MGPFFWQLLTYSAALTTVILALGLRFLRALQHWHAVELVDFTSDGCVRKRVVMRRMVGFVRWEDRDASPVEQQKYYEGVSWW